MKVVELSGGVGGARMALGLSAIDGIDLTVVVNVADDLPTHGLYVSPDLDTVIYTLAGMEGPHGWGRAGDSFVTNTELARFGMNNSFQLGDLDLALKIYRTERLGMGDSLSAITDTVRARFDIAARVLPATDDRVRTVVTTTDGLVLSFQSYFVDRRHRDHVARLEYEGAASAVPAPGVIEAIASADIVLIAPSNPPLSVWPILAISPIESIVREHSRVVAVSPLIGGRAVRGPAEAVMSDLGLGTGTTAVLASYRGLIQHLVVDTADSSEAGMRDGVSVVAMDTLIPGRVEAERLALGILGL